VQNWRTMRSMDYGPILARIKPMLVKIITRESDEDAVCEELERKLARNERNDRYYLGADYEHD
jgi:hypothetical protein